MIAFLKSSNKKNADTRDQAIYLFIFTKELFESIKNEV